MGVLVVSSGTFQQIFVVNLSIRLFGSPELILGGER
jgi:hypothetical protein